VQSAGLQRDPFLKCQMEMAEGFVIEEFNDVDYGFKGGYRGVADPCADQASCLRCFRKVPLLYSSKAIRNSSRVFMTIGPYHATGSPMGLPEK
jgi:hypothetical protein